MRVIIIQQNVPMCPECSSLMSTRHQDGKLFFFCHDCLHIYKVIENGQAEIELLVSDEQEESA